LKDVRTVFGKMKAAKKRTAAVTAALAAVVFLAGAFNTGLRVRKYEIETEKVGAPVRIVLLADLHAKKYGENQKRLLRKIEKLNPDLIAIAGDLADQKEKDDGAVMLLKAIAGKYPVFYVSGNHEYLSGKPQEKKELFRSNGAILLEGACREFTVNGQWLNICGIDDADDGSSELERQLMAAIPENARNFSVLLSHRPEYADVYRKFSYDLVLSGHTHGGQWRIPFLVNGFFAPGQGWFPDYSGGAYPFEDMTLIVSRGLANSSKLPRLFNPPEIVAVDIIPKTQ